MHDECSVLFVAGGRSSRMGRPKAWLPFKGRPLLDHLVERMLRHFPEAVVVTAPDAEVPPTRATVVYDERPGEGPVAGMETGLRAVTRPFAFVTSCDVPFLNPLLAAFLLDRARHADVAVPEWNGRLQPLQAVYRTTVQPLLTEQLEQGRRRPVDLYERVDTVIVREDELRAVDPEGRSFLNMNTPEEYELALARWLEWRPE